MSREGVFPAEDKNRLRSFSLALSIAWVLIIVPVSALSVFAVITWAGQTGGAIAVSGAVIGELPAELLVISFPLPVYVIAGIIISSSARKRGKFAPSVAVQIIPVFFAVLLFSFVASTMSETGGIIGAPEDSAVETGVGDGNGTEDSAIVTDVGEDSEGAIRNIDDATPEIGSIVEFGGYDWRVLDLRDGKALLHSEYVFYTVFNPSPAEREELPQEQIDRLAQFSREDSGTWERSYLRDQLNNSFYDNFTPEQKQRIAETVVVNNGNPWYEASPDSDDTVDRIFVLSLDEVLRYFGDSGQILEGIPQDRRASIDDQYNDARIAYSSLVSGGPGRPFIWWLRTPNANDYSVVRVRSDGTILMGDNILSGSSFGARPAMWVYLS